MSTQMLDATQVGKWLTAWTANLTPDEQAQVQSAWAKLSLAQQNMVIQNAYGGPAEYQSQAMGIIQQAAQGPKTAAAAPRTLGVPAPATSKSGSTAATTAAQQEVLSSSGAVSTTAVGSGSVPPVGSSAANKLIQQYMYSPLWQGVQGGTAQDAANALGVDYTSANQQYQQYVQQFEAGQARITGAARGQFQGQQAAPMDETTFIQQIAQSQDGIWGPVIGMIAYAWQEQNGTALPPALAQQIRADLRNMNTPGNAAYDPNGSANLQAQMLNSVYQIQQAASKVTASGGQATDLNLQTEVNTFLTELSTFAPSIYAGGGTSSTSLADASPTSTIGQYIAANPSATGEAAAQEGATKKAAIDFMTNYGIPDTASNLTYLSNQQNLTNMGDYVSWMQTEGMPITAGTLQTLMAMPFSDPGGSTAPASGSGGAFLLAQPVPGANMNYGQYVAVSANMNTLWQQNFDTTPTTAQLQWGVGKTPTQIQDFVDNSPSAVPNVTVGQYNDYLSFVNSLDTSGATTHAFSSQVDDSLINELHQHVTAQATGSAHPGAMT